MGPFSPSTSRCACPPFASEPFCGFAVGSITGTTRIWEGSVVASGIFPSVWKLVLVPGLAKAVVLRHCLRRRSRRRVEPGPSRAHGIPIEHSQALPGSGHCRENHARCRHYQPQNKTLPSFDRGVRLGLRALFRLSRDVGEKNRLRARFRLRLLCGAFLSCAGESADGPACDGVSPYDKQFALCRSLFRRRWRVFVRRACNDAQPSQWFLGASGRLRRLPSAAASCIAEAIGSNSVSASTSAPAA